jgi:hypothetical protein
MSQAKRKYKQIDAFFSRIRPVAPDSPSRAATEKETTGTSSFFVSSTAASPADGWSGFFTGIDRGKILGFSYDKDRVTSLEEAPLPLPENTLRVPLMVSGKTIGSIQAARKEAGWTAQEIEIVSAVAAQLARHIENLPLPGK